MFTLFEHSSINLLYILNCSFKSVHVFKPITSKQGNSEIYIICIDYQLSKNNFNQYFNKIFNNLNTDVAYSKTMLSINIIPKYYLKQLIKCCRLFMNIQITIINKNIENYQTDNYYEMKNIKNLRYLVNCKFFNKFNIIKLNNNRKLLPDNSIDYSNINMKREFNKSIDTDSLISKNYHVGTYTERCAKNNINSRDKLILLKNLLNSLFYDNTFNFRDEIFLKIYLNNSKIFLN